MMLEGMLATPQVVQELTKVWFNTTPQLPAKQVFLVTARSQGAHSPAGLQAVNTTLWHPALKRQDRLGKEPFAGFGTVVEDITEPFWTKKI